MTTNEVGKLIRLNAQQEEIINVIAEQKGEMMHVMLKAKGYLAENRLTLSKDGTPTSMEMELHELLIKLGAEVPL